jgi:hypothetical protein
MKNLKTLSKQVIFLLLSTFFVNEGNAQSVKSVVKPSVIILNAECRGLPNDATQLGNILRSEVEKLDEFDVTDKYDVAYLIEKNKLNISNCYGKTCLLEIAKVIPTDYIITGGAELIGQIITVTIRMINVQKQSIEKTTTIEFNNMPDEIKSMFKITVETMFNKTVNQDLLILLTKQNNFENTLNNPNKNKINLQGPRFGFITVLGQDRETLKANKSDGGYEVNPLFFQFGYQFEKQYLNEGNFQALFEVIPMISGLEQSMFIPNLAILNGFRNSKNGWEFAFGPTISIAKQLDGHVDGATKKFMPGSDPLDPNKSLITRMDSRGDSRLTGALLLALGKTLKSGKLNIPINFWCLFPSTEGITRLGISFGYNTKP